MDRETPILRPCRTSQRFGKNSVGGVVWFLEGGAGPTNAVVDIEHWGRLGHEVHEADGVT